MKKIPRGEVQQRGGTTGGGKVTVKITATLPSPPGNLAKMVCLGHDKTMVLCSIFLERANFKGGQDGMFGS